MKDTTKWLSEWVGKMREERENTKHVLQNRLSEVEQHRANIATLDARIAEMERAIKHLATAPASPEVTLVAVVETPAKVSKSKGASK